MSATEPYEIKYVQPTNAQSIHSLDLRQVIDHERVDGAEFARVTLRRTGAAEEASEAETAEVIFWPALRRGACAWGGDAVWTDAASAREVAERVIVTGEVIS